ncbi:MAG: asparagine--tRNA ligase [Kiritimatiellae bacterium]|jgi:asparaginyl-tRNA synthetase|nr:asparagine--tRNA ligase [Kiritimatiellia bacterium]
MKHTLIKDISNFDDETIVVRGWVQAKRTGGKVIFITLRDGTALLQCIIESFIDSFDVAKELNLESSVILEGKVRKEERAPGGYELAVTKVTAIHINKEDFPISKQAHGIDFLMNNRHLWLRSQRPVAIMKVRHTIVKACRDFFDENGFTLIDTPILTPGVGEDAQSLFPVQYFGKEVFLTQTGQLYLECAALALGKVYCFGPTFRAEKSKTRRHLTEFWMIEPEIAFAELDDVIAIAEQMICFITKRVLESNKKELILLDQNIEKLEKIQAPFYRITYSEAVEILRSEKTLTFMNEELQKESKKLAEKEKMAKDIEAQLQGGVKAWKELKLKKELKELKEDIVDLQRDIGNKPKHIELAQNFIWGKDLGGSDETIISRMHDRPVFVTHYPKEAKAFYMKHKDADSKVVENVDLLAPDGYGEIIGGSQREDDLDVLIDAMKANNLDPMDYDWYVDLRKYGSIPHGGFGLGIERTVAWLCGLKHVRETIPFPRTMGRIYP